MANITLRENIREIERLIEGGKYDDALVHCHQILESFPKHIDTYRLLAKTFIELKQTANSKMVFERILSVYPDDFISHLGLSYIAEEQSDINNSVMHMERAFEIQPSNTDIQEELKRLYKSRDGVEPNRIRLTRGALIRMYARSNLYSQAISEIQIALHEHPQRVDLELILAKMFMLSNQKIEAVEKCIQIVSEYPYCFEANKILSDTIADASEAQDVKIFKQRLVEIDPYFKYSSKDQPDVYSVPDVAVSLSQIEVKQGGMGESFDWNSLIEKYWLDNNEPPIEFYDDEEINWDEIIDKHFNLSKSLKDEIITPIISEEKESLNIQGIKETAVDDTDEIEKNPQDEIDTIKDIPDWIQKDDEGEKPVNVNGESSEKIEDDEYPGLADGSTPPNLENIQSEDKPLSVWIQETKDESGEIPIQPGEDSNQEIKSIAITEEAINDEDRSQYFEVVLKDAHDALLSGFPQRSLECYQKLIQENQLTEEVLDQLERDLAQFSGNMPLWLLLGDAYQKLGKSDQALEIYRKAERQFKNVTGENE